MSNEHLIWQFNHSSEIKSIPRHSHNGYQMIYVKDGRVNISVSRKNYDVLPESLVFINHLETHNIRMLSDCYERYYLNISPRLAEKHIRDKTLLSIFFNRPPDFEHVLRIGETGKTVENMLSLIGAEAEKHGAYSNEACSLLLKYLLICLYREYPSKFPSVDQDILVTVWQVKNYIENNYNKELQLVDIAKSFALSPYYLSRNFKAITGYGFKQYSLLCRISSAKDALRNTDLSILQIALSTGFTDHSNFTKYFRRETGMTPTEYRRKFTLQGENE